MDITADENQEVLATIGEIYDFLHHEKGSVSFMPFFPNYPIQRDEGASLIYALREEDCHSEAQGAMVLDISDTLFHDIQVYEARSFWFTHSGVAIDLSSLYRHKDEEVMPNQKIQRFYSSDITKEHQVKKLICSGDKDKIVHRAKLSNSTAMTDLFKMAVEDGFSNMKLLAGPYASMSRDGKAAFPEVSVCVNHDYDSAILVFNMTEALPYIGDEWRAGLLKALQPQ